jgi:hypothetical protein
MGRVWRDEDLCEHPTAYNMDGRGTSWHTDDIIEVSDPSRYPIFEGLLEVHCDDIEVFYSPDFIYEPYTGNEAIYYKLLANPPPVDGKKHARALEIIYNSGLTLRQFYGLEGEFAWTDANTRATPTFSNMSGGTPLANGDTVNLATKSITADASKTPSTVTLTAGDLTVSASYVYTLGGDLTVGGIADVSGTVTPGTYSCTISGALGLTVESGGAFGGNTAYSLYLTGNLTNNETFSAPNASGTFQMSGQNFYGGPSYSANSGLVDFNTFGGITNLTANWTSAYDIKVSQAGGKLNFNGYNLTAHDAIATGTLSAAGGNCVATFNSLVFTGTYDSAGNGTFITGRNASSVAWSNSGTFLSEGSTYTFQGQSGSGTYDIKGDNIWPQIDITVTNACTYRFENGKTQTISYSAYFSGSKSQTLTITSISGAAAWLYTIGLGLSQNCYFCNVSWSDASGGDVAYAMHSTDGGHNTNWKFDTILDIIIDYSSRSGTLEKSDANYTTCHNASTADNASTSGDLDVGQILAGGTYYIYRGVLEFDTSTIPSNAIITYAKLKGFYCAYTQGGGTYDLVVQNGQPTYPHNPFVVGDYSYSYYSGNGGSINNSALTYGKNFEIILNSTGWSWINPGGMTKFVLRTSDDISGTAPIANDYIDCGQLNYSCYPTIEILYSVPGTVDVPDTTDGYRLANDTNHTPGYPDVRRAATAALIDAELIVGQSGGAVVAVDRTYLLFDTSDVPAGAIITWAQISLYCYDKQTGGSDFDIVVQNGQPTYPHNPVVVGDFDYTQYSGNGGSINSTAIIKGNRFVIALNPTGIGWINRSGFTKLLLISSRDINEDYPGGLEYAFVGAHNLVGQQARMEIRYVYPGAFSANSRKLIARGLL